MEYIPLGDELSFEAALVQASQAFDLAAMIATEARDAARLLDVGATWVKMADYLGATNEAVEEKEEKKKLDEKSDFPTGFTSQRGIEEEIARD